MEARNYVEIATTYARGVVSGEIPACKWVKRACQRQLSDLKRAETPGFPYRFDAPKAAKPCKFIELLPHIKGEWAKKKLLLVLEPWQIFIVTTLFGWVKPDGNRRFTTSYVEVPKKNGKSALASGIGLYMLTADGEAGPEVLSAATTTDQAAITWRVSAEMANRCPGLRARFGVKVGAHAITTDNAGTYKTLSRDRGGNHDGINTHCGLIDELHAHNTPDMFENVESSMAARAQPLLFVITTAGSNQAGVCYLFRTEVVMKVLEGVLPAEHVFGIIYTIDDEKQWQDPAQWRIANPNYGVSVGVDYLATKHTEASSAPSKQSNFKTKHLNVWVNADSAFLDMQAWAACADPEELTEDDFIGEPCWIGLDLAAKVDVAAMIKVFRRGRFHYVFPKFYLPEDRAEEREGRHYASWATSGHLTLTDGNVIDFAVIEQDIRDASDRFNVQAVGYDPWNAQDLVNRLTADGFPMNRYDNNVRNMSEPMKQVGALVGAALSKKVDVLPQLRHPDNPVLNWMASNLVCHEDKKGNIFPNKSGAKNKIDGMVALIMAEGEIITAEPDGQSVYETRGLRSF